MTSAKSDWERTLQVFERLPELYLILSADLKVLTASNAYLQTIGLSRSFVLEAELTVLLETYNTDCNQISEQILSSLQETASTKQIRTISAQQLKNGYYGFIQTPMLNEQGEIAFIIHKLHNVTRLTDTLDLLAKVEEAGNTGSYRFNLQTQQLKISDGMFRLLGYVPGAFQPSTGFINSISHPDDITMVDNVIAEAISKKTAYEYTRRIFHPSGAMRYLLIKGKVLVNEAGEATYLLGVLHDITEQTLSNQALLKAHEDLQKSSALLQSVFDTTMVGMSLMKPIRDEHGKIEDFTIMLVSKGLEIETGRTDLAGKVYTTEFPGVRKAGLFELMLKVMATGISEYFEYFYPFEGFNKWYSCTFVKMDDGLVATNLDISPVRQAEATIRELEESQKLEVFKACIYTQEEERKRIAEDLRNGIGQLLYAVKINLKHVESSKALNDPEEFHRVKQYTDKILADAIKEVRRLSHQMTPAILEDFGLEETLIELCKQFSPDIDLSYRIIGLKTRLEGYVEVSVYRMVQELLLNTMTHAKASKAIIEVNQEDSILTVMVQDNGTGFNHEQAKSKGLGLATLFNKVRLLNGTVRIDANHGTKVTISLPIA